MQKWFILGVFMALMLVGCQSSPEDGDTQTADPAPDVAIPTVAVELDPNALEGGTPAPGDSPRGGSGNGLPPTYTPDAQEVISGAPTSVARPGGPVITEDTQTYTVVRGDTLGEIAKAFGVELDDLVRVNRFTIDDIDKIYPGQVIVIPE